MRQIVFEALKVSDIFVILPSKDGSESDCLETKFKTVTF